MEAGGAPREGSAARVARSAERGSVEHARQRASFTAANPTPAPAAAAAAAAAAARAPTIALESEQSGAEQIHHLPDLESGRVEAGHLTAAIGGERARHLPVVPWSVGLHPPITIAEMRGRPCGGQRDGGK